MSKATASIGLINSNDSPIYVQVEPVAGLYVLEKGQQIEIVSESETDYASFEIYEDGNMRYLTICHSNEYYVVLDGKRVHCSKYLTNVEGLSTPASAGSDQP